MAPRYYEVDVSKIDDVENRPAVRLGFLTLGVLATAVLVSSPKAQNLNDAGMRFDDPSLNIAAPPSEVFPAAKAFVTETALRWRVSPEDALAYMEYAFRASEKFGVDPILVLSVMGVESSWRRDAVSVTGAEGLMQIARRWHDDKIARRGVASNEPMPAHINIEVGTEVLRDYLEAASKDAGSYGAKNANWPRHALLAYSGNRDNPDAKYPEKVKKEYFYIGGRLASLAGAEEVNAALMSKYSASVRAAYGSPEPLRGASASNNSQRLR